LGYEDVSLNISGGLRYIVIWFNIASIIADIEIIHGDFKYKGNVEVGITQNFNLIRIPFNIPTLMQFEFLMLFFPLKKRSVIYLSITTL